MYDWGAELGGAARAARAVGIDAAAGSAGQNFNTH